MVTGDELVPVALEKVVAAAQGDGVEARHFAVLHDRGGGRRMPVRLDAGQAFEVSLTLEGIEPARPFPSHFAARLVKAAGGRVGRVRLDRNVEVGDLGAAVAATIEIIAADGIVEVDARASDAIGLAAVTSSPIVVSEGELAGSERSRHRDSTWDALHEAAINGRPARWRRVGT